MIHQSWEFGRPFAEPVTYAFVSTFCLSCEGKATKNIKVEHLYLMNYFEFGMYVVSSRRRAPSMLSFRETL